MYDGQSVKHQVHLFFRQEEPYSQGQLTKAHPSGKTGVAISKGWREQWGGLAKAQNQQRELQGWPFDGSASIIRNVAFDEAGLTR